MGYAAFVTFSPELGQAAFSNQQMGAYALPTFVERGLDEIGAVVAGVHLPDSSDERELWHQDPTNNVGSSANFKNNVFTIRAYCWCDGEGEHEDGCPPNFECDDFKVSWYKHSHRGASCNHQITAKEWREMSRRCIDSISS